MTEPIAAIELAEIPLTTIHPSPVNPRGHAAAQDLEELAASIQAHGVLEPIIVRPVNGHYELVAGERRWRASELAGLEAIPALVRELDDETALEITVIENLQRRDLHPLQEAEGIQALVEQRGWNLATVAEQIGRSPAWVARRARLSKLSEAWRDSVADPESAVHGWGAAHLQEIALLDPSAQDELLGSFGSWRQWTAGDVRESVAKHLRKLSAAPWKVADGDLVPEAGPCTTCPKRSSCSPGLFDDEEPASDAEISPTDRCLDPTCWNRKAAAWVTQRHEAVVAQHGDDLVLMKTGYGNDPDAPEELVKGAVSDWQVTKALKKDPDSVPALVVSGPGLGQIRWVKPTGTGSTALAKSRKRTLAEREEQLRLRRLRRAAEALLEDARKPPSAAKIYALAALFGTRWNRDSAREWHHGDLPEPVRQPAKASGSWTRWKLADGLTPADARMSLWVGVHDILESRVASAHDDAAVLHRELRGLARVLELDWPAAWTAAVDGLPEPKSWAKERTRAGKARKEAAA